MANLQIEGGNVMDIARSRGALVRNLPKRGWTVDGSTAKMGDFTLTLGGEGWVLMKGGKETASGAYGPTQMGDVRRAVERAGGSMPTIPGAKKARKPLTEEQKAKLREKRQQKGVARMGLTAREKEV